MRTSLLLLLLAPCATKAQRPDLTGTWVAAPGETPRALPAAPGPVLGARFALAMDGSTLVMTRAGRDQSLVTRLPLDGSVVSSRIPGRMCEGEAQFHETATWEGDALAFTTVGQTPAGTTQQRPATSRRLLRLEAPDRLVVEGTMMQGGQARQVGSVYRRTTDQMPAAQPATSGPAATITQLAWLGATWISSGNVTTEERWTPPASGGMIAVARTLRGESLASFEFLCIAERNGTLAYLAMPDGRSPATVFTLTSITPTSATFENPAHDFPKMIRYSLSSDGTTLETMIAGAGGARPQTVTLKRQ